jgi:hypothetical protein
MTLFHNYIYNPIKTTLDSQKFTHLESVGQTYTEHLGDSMKYSWISLKSSLYFFAHGIYPDAFETNGSDTIVNLNSILQNKIKNIKERETRESLNN